MTTLVSPDQLEHLQRIAAQLGLDLQLQEEAAGPPLGDPEEDLEAAKKGLEDLFNLL